VTTIRSGSPKLWNEAIMIILSQYKDLRAKKVFVGGLACP